MPALPVILLIGHDTILTYLIERYAERTGYEVHVQPSVPALSAVHDLQPTVMLFSSIADFEAAQAQLAQPSNCEIPLVVCSAVNDQAQVRELGADYCLVHPLTYGSFLAALTAISERARRLSSAQT